MLTNEERNYLMNSMQELLDEYDYTYTDSALDTILDKWYAQKEHLIEAFKKHPNYIEGKFMIAFSCDYDREINDDIISVFSQWLESRMYDNPELLSPEINEQRIAEGCALLPRSMYDFVYYGRLYDCFRSRTISEESAEKILNAFPALHVHVGEKSSRVMNKICKYLGYDKHPDYNREYAKFADALSPLTIKRHTILSLNPLDYLTMSFGNSWASCHTIDKENKRRMPNSYEGQYSSGTVSYMLDPSSMVFYTVDKAYDGDDYWTQPKICRQMFHWGEDKLVQARLYPQDNDYNGDAYKPYREIVQEIMSIIFEFPNLWTTTKGTGSASRYIESYGTHYRDYTSYDNCRLCRIQGRENENKFKVGARPICIQCGCTHDICENINCCAEDGCYYCTNCGDWVDEDDVRWVDGEPYCEDCIRWCDHCHEYHTSEETYIASENIYVCESCLGNYYRYCDHCDEWYHQDDITYVESTDRYVCDDCLENHYIQCDNCDEYYLAKHIIENADGNYICENCLDAYFAKCPDCNEWYLKEVMVEDPLGDMLCENCAEARAANEDEEN